MQSECAHAFHARSSKHTIHRAQTTLLCSYGMYGTVSHFAHMHTRAHRYVCDGFAADIIIMCQTCGVQHSSHTHAHTLQTSHTHTHKKTELHTHLCSDGTFCTRKCATFRRVHARILYTSHAVFFTLCRPSGERRRIIQNIMLKGVNW